MTLIECKLWRNPQARRVVIAQILEYAALIRRLSFGDLTARLKRRLGVAASNPLFDLARERWPQLDEAQFVDGVSRSLEFGDFHLIVAGDGIRSDVQSVSAHLNATGFARLSLLELSIWESPSLPGTVIVPSVPLRTEIIQQRVFVTPAGLPLHIEEESSDAAAASVDHVVDPGSAERRAANRAFWQRFIDGVEFDHPEQAKPRHGGDNWVRIPLPAPIGWLTAFRSTGSKPVVGLFVTLKDEAGQELYEQIAANLTSLKEETGLDLIAKPLESDAFSGEIGVYRARAQLPTEDAQLNWLNEAANQFVSMLRLQTGLVLEPAE